MGTPLSTLLNRMNRYQALSTVEEQFKVHDIDEAIRDIRRDFQLPWTMQRGSLRVFDGVLVYPTASDHDEVAYLDTRGQVYEDRLRFKETSLQQFFENYDEIRNLLTDIWDNGTRYLGVRLNGINDYIIPPAVLVDTAESTAGFTASGDASNILVDFVMFDQDDNSTEPNNASIRFTVTQALNTALVEKNLAATGLTISDTLYQRKFFFIKVLFSSVPTSVQLRFGNNNTNYLFTNVTTQFSGQAFRANQRNLLAFDLNNASTVGTINPNSFAYYAVNLINAPSGLYNIDTSWLRQWQLIDYWYYSRFDVQTITSSIANQEFFMDDNGNYAIDSQLVGDKQWADVVMFDAMLTTANDLENNKIVQLIAQERQEAWEKMFMRYPSMRPKVTTMKYKFLTDFNRDV